ncbi:MAG TPA: TolC family protein [Candidatus Baltobacteraceae bacterium]|nr:TolC family protein [Candidatus Baltobacteraceae bacterium]
MLVRSLRAVAATAILSSVFCAPACAQGLTLAQAVQYALVHSPTVAKQQASVDQLHAAYLRTRANALPAVTGSLQNQMQKSQNYSGAYSIIGTSQASVFSQNTASIGTNYTFNGGLAQIQTQVARQQFEQAQTQLTQTQHQIASEVANAYFTYAGKLESVGLDNGDLAYQNALLSVAKAKERAGVAAGVDVLSANAQVEKSHYTLAAAQADAENSREALAQTIGAPLTSQFEVPAAIAQPQLPRQPLAALIALAQQNRPEVRSALQGVEIARTNRRTADTDLFPQIQTFASFGNQFSPTLAVEEQRSVPPGITIPRGTPGYWNLGVISSVSFPFWDWGSRRANHANLDAQIASANADLQAQQAQVELDVRQAYRAAQTALAQLASAQDESRYAKEASRVARLQYQNGIITLIDVQQRQQASLAAQADLYNARVAYATAIVKLRAATGIYTPQQDVADFEGR